MDTSEKLYEMFYYLNNILGTVSIIDIHTAKNLIGESRVSCNSFTFELCNAVVNGNKQNVTI